MPSLASRPRPSRRRSPRGRLLFARRRRARAAALRRPGSPRRRPPADLVHILSPTTGFSYPSGHAVFFTWLSFMLAFSLAPRLAPRVRPILWISAAVLIALTCLARVWAGAHWPSDVLGGVLLGIGWSAFVLWLPERWLPSPTFKWFSLAS